MGVLRVRLDEKQQFFGLFFRKKGAFYYGQSHSFHFTF